MKRTVVVVLSLWSLILMMLSAVPSTAQQKVAGAVYTMTNAPNGNAVLVFNQAADGTLTPGGTFPTGGLGTGGREPDFGLGNAGALPSTRVPEDSMLDIA